MSSFLSKSAHGLFATSTLTGHLLRGAVAFGLLYGAIQGQGEHPALSLAAGLAALVVLRGCPMCWTIGLIETLHHRTRGLWSAVLRRDVVAPSAPQQERAKT
jgi:hypothetical protein